jgi:pyruvate/2-oxoglutarate/acetoin dehydrogenase E1 component
MYGRKGEVRRDGAAMAPIGKARLMRGGSDVTIVATMLMVDRTMVAAEQLSAEGIDAEVIDLCWLRPLDVDTVAESVARTGRLVVVEEQVHAGGWGATLVSELTMRDARWKALPRAVSMRDDVLVPYSPPLEDALIPSADAIVAAVRTSVG